MRLAKDIIDINIKSSFSEESVSEANVLDQLAKLLLLIVKNESTDGITKRDSTSASPPDNKIKYK